MTPHFVVINILRTPVPKAFGDQILKT